MSQAIALGEGLINTIGEQPMKEGEMPVIEKLLKDFGADFITNAQDNLRKSKSIASGDINDIKVQFTKTDGESAIETWMDGIDARCFLHEYDHLQGTNFIDLVGDFKLQMAKQKRDKRFKKLGRTIKRG